MIQKTEPGFQSGCEFPVAEHLERGIVWIHVSLSDFKPITWGPAGMGGREVLAGNKAE